MGEGCIFSGMVEVEGEYSFHIPVRDVRRGQSDKLEWRGGVARGEASEHNVGEGGQQWSDQDSRMLCF